VLAFSGGLGHFKENKIFKNNHAGVCTESGARPTLVANKLHAGHGWGVQVLCLSGCPQLFALN
jgi:hypothetical protein